MDRRVLDSMRHQEETLELPWTPTKMPGIPQKALPRRSVESPIKPARKKNHVRVGREVVKSGMAASLAVVFLTGLKIVRPMSLHPVASWVFLGLSVIHMVAYDKNGASHKRKVRTHTTPMTGV